MINVYYPDLGYTLSEESAALDIPTFMGIIGKHIKKTQHKSIL